MGVSDTLRTAETLARYRERRDGGVPKDLRDLKLIADGIYWTVVENEFPYDKILKEHHLLVPKREFQQVWEMTFQEHHELNELMYNWGREKRYDAMMLNFPHNRTVPGLFHYHLIKFITLTNFHG